MDCITSNPCHAGDAVFYLCAAQYLYSAAGMTQNRTTLAEAFSEGTQHNYLKDPGLQYQPLIDEVVCKNLTGSLIRIEHF